MSILDDYKPKSLDEILQGSKLTSGSQNILKRAKEKINSSSNYAAEILQKMEDDKKKHLAEIEAQKALIPAKVEKKISEIFKDYYK